MQSSFPRRHFFPALDSIQVEKLKVIPQRLQVYVRMHLLIACPHSSALNPTLMKKLNSRNAQGVLMLSKWLQCETGRHCMLLRGRDLFHALSLMVLQHLHNHNPSHGGLMSCFFFAVYLLSTPMAM